MKMKLSELFTQPQKEAEHSVVINYQHSGSSAYDYKDLSLLSIKQNTLESQNGQTNVINQFKKQVKQSLNIINTPKSNLFGHKSLSWSQQNFFKQSSKSNNRINTETSRGTNNYLTHTAFYKPPSSQNQRRIVEGNPLKYSQQILQNRRIDSADWANLKDGIDQQLVNKQHTIKAQNSQSSISLNCQKQISMKERMKTVNNQFYKMKLVFSDHFNTLSNDLRKEDTSRYFPGSCSSRYNSKYCSSSNHLMKDEISYIDFQKQKNKFTEQTDRENKIFNEKSKFNHQMISSICMAQIKPIKGGKVKKLEKEKFQHYYDSVSERLHDIKQTRTLNNFEFGKIIDFDWKKIKYHPANEKPDMSLKEIRDLYLRERIKGAQNQMENIISNREKQELLKKQKDNQLREDKYIDEYRKKTFFLFKNLEEEEIQKNQLLLKQQKKKESSNDFDKLLAGIQQNEDEEIRENRDRVKLRIIRNKLKDYLQKLIKLNITLQEAMANNIFLREPYNRPRSIAFFDAVKQNDMEQVIKLLEKDRYLVYQYDKTLQTPLHWAAKRGFISIAEILIGYNCDINSKDKLGRSPLYYTYMEGQNEMGRFLLFNQASPFSSKQNDIKKAIESREDNDRFTIKTAQEIHYMMIMSSFKQKQRIWNENKFLFDDRLKNKQAKVKK